MTNSIATEEKKWFLRWILKYHQLKRREAVWIVNYLLGNDKSLEHIHFVEGAKHCPRALVLSTTDCDASPLQFYNENRVTVNAETAYHSIRDNPNEPLYLEIIFESKEPNMRYLAILEDNPYALIEANLSQEEQQLVEDIMAHSLHIYKRERLLTAIDEALDTRDEARFTALTLQLQQFDNRSTNELSISKETSGQHETTNV